eukprot:TRINITY_DN6583_c1_g1_i1.p1 TRINITY_DN6583_c1_g1~~TRINITY_DN6583_c1_g1_i1.p1  ORF type:complete len:328 (-),score=34.46 TRINITY_DN6583_c1_g1_i1:339-1322(-)
MISLPSLKFKKQPCLSKLVFNYKKATALTTQMRKSVPLYQADAFTSTKFGGNPAAVCLLDEGMNDDLRQKIAAEMNLAETAFLEKVDGHEDFVSGSRFGLRWFTPKVEVPLCGHATLASAVVLMEEVGNLNNKLTFDTLSGPLTVEKVSTASGQLYRMVLPLADPVDPLPEHVNIEHPLIQATIGDTSMVKEIVFAGGSLKYLLIVLKPDVNKLKLLDIKPNVSKMSESIGIENVRAVCVTCQGQGEIDVLSRFFSPWCGIDEDPVTGSAHAVLAPYWSKVLGKRSMRAQQCSDRRGDLVMTADAENKVVQLDGSGVVIMKAQLYID